MTFHGSGFTEGGEKAGPDSKSMRFDRLGSGSTSFDQVGVLYSQKSDPDGRGPNDNDASLYLG